MKLVAGAFTVTFLEVTVALEAGTATVARAEVRAKADMVTDRIM
jgi:hypothetical protein